MISRGLPTMSNQVGQDYFLSKGQSRIILDTKKNVQSK
jgi:hypothetical protein